MTSSMSLTLARLAYLIEGRSGHTKSGDTLDGDVTPKKIDLTRRGDTEFTHHEIRDPVKPIRLPKDWKSQDEWREKFGLGPRKVDSSRTDKFKSTVKRAWRDKFGLSPKSPPTDPDAPPLDKLSPEERTKALYAKIARLKALRAK